MVNNNLTNAKLVKNDEFYTQYGDIQKEIEVYLEYNLDAFRGKVVYCSCDYLFDGGYYRVECNPRQSELRMKIDKSAVDIDRK
ncbi:MAG TPA: hypothetical protein ENI57_12735 [Ignavibacteria bacterium]|nr:hypothetical protein [Ignavibacteria bacterium]